MEQFSEYLIPFIGLKEGLHRFEFKIDNTFFESFDFLDFRDSRIQVSLDFEKKNKPFGAEFHSKR